MIFNKYLVALVLSAGVLDVAFAQNGGNGGQGNGNDNNNNNNNNNQQNNGNQNNNNNNNTNNNNNGATATTGNNAQVVLEADNVQTASALDGQGNAEGVKAGQAASATDPDNFINFCTGKTLTNGAQVKGGSCNGIVMGDIPATANMVSTVITNPTQGCIAANTDFDVTLQVANLNAGIFTNPTVTYYSAPQALKNGNIVGHVHVTIQALGNDLFPKAPPVASEFAFFKGIDDAGDGNGGLKAAVTGGLPAGNYRLCTMSSAANHQPVIMPVAQRGAQDDCVRFSTADNCAAAGNGGNGNAGNGNGQQNAGGQNKASGGNNGNGGNTGNGGAAGNGTFVPQGNNGSNGNNGAGQGQGFQRGQGFRRGRGRWHRNRYQNRAFVL